MNAKQDTAERTAQRKEQNAIELSKIRLYNLTELEPVIGVTHRTLVNYIKSGRLTATKIGGKWKVTENNLTRFLNGETK